MYKCIHISVSIIINITSNIYDSHKPLQKPWEAPGNICVPVKDRENVASPKITSLLHHVTQNDLHIICGI